MEIRIATIFFFFLQGEVFVFFCLFFSPLCAAPGFNQFLIVDSVPVCKGLTVALELLTRELVKLPVR